MHPRRDPGPGLRQERPQRGQAVPHEPGFLLARHGEERSAVTIQPLGADAAVHVLEDARGIVRPDSEAVFDEEGHRIRGQSEGLRLRAPVPATAPQAQLQGVDEAGQAVNAVQGNARDEAGVQQAGMSRHDLHRHKTAEGEPDQVRAAAVRVLGDDGGHVVGGLFE